MAKVGFSQSYTKFYCLPGVITVSAQAKILKKLWGWIEHQRCLSLDQNTVCFIPLGACKVPSVVSDSLWLYDGSLPDSSVHGIFPGKNTGVGCHALLQEIVLTHRSNLYLWHLLQWQTDSLPLAPPYPNTLAFIYSNSSGSPTSVHSVSSRSSL